MIRLPDLNDVLELTKTRALIWKKLIDTGWSEDPSFQNHTRWQEYESSHENFHLILRVKRIGKKRSSIYPELWIGTEDPTLKVVYSKSRRLLKITNLIIKNR